MGKGFPRSLGKQPAPAVTAPTARKVIIDLDKNPVVISNIDGASGVGWGTAVVGDFPEGDILLLGACWEGTLTKNTAGIVADFDGDISFGTAPTADATLSGAEVNLIPSTSTVQAVSSVSTTRAVSTSTESGTIHDNTDGSLEINANLLIDDADISADDQTVTIRGKLIVLYAVMGDN